MFSHIFELSVMGWFYGSFLSTNIYLRVDLHAVGFSGRDLEIKEMCLSLMP